MYRLSNGPNEKERTKRNDHVGMQNGAIFTIVYTKLLIGLKINFYEIFSKAACVLIPCSLANFLITESLLSLSNTEILCEEIL